MGWEKVQSYWLMWPTQESFPCNGQLGAWTCSWRNMQMYMLHWAIACPKAKFLGGSSSGVAWLEYTRWEAALWSRGHYIKPFTGQKMSTASIRNARSEQDKAFPGTRHLWQCFAVVLCGLNRGRFGHCSNIITTQSQQKSSVRMNCPLVRVGQEDVRRGETLCF